MTFDPQPLPFPEAIDDAGIEELGAVPVTPLVEAVRRTVETFRGRFQQGDLVPEAHGLEAAVASS